MKAMTPGPWRQHGVDILGSDTYGSVLVAVAKGGQAGINPEANATVITACPEILAALRDFVSYGMCRQANTAERKMMAEHFAVLADKYNPILERLGMSPTQISQVEFDEIVEAQNGRP